ncbi:hypothetical protein G6F56_008148 [Rhizopus delemar]|nr:hypothetical protein G6F56_008148 [Rhizopus delemar]
MYKTNGQLDSLSTKNCTQNLNNTKWTPLKSLVPYKRLQTTLDFKQSQLWNYMNKLSSSKITTMKLNQKKLFPILQRTREQAHLTQSSLNNDSYKEQQEEKVVLLYHETSEDLMEEGASFPIPRNMEANDPTSKANISSTTWTQTSIYKNTHPMEIPSDEDIYNGTDIDKRSSIQIPRSRDYRKITDTGQKFSVELFYNSGGDEEKTNSELSTTEPIPSMRAFQDGGGTGIERNTGEGRLYVQDRPERCVRSCTNPLTFKKIFNLSKRRDRLPVPLLSFKLNNAPRIFSKIMKHAIEPLRKEGIRLILYLDGLCILSKSQQDMQQTTSRLSYLKYFTKVGELRQFYSKDWQSRYKGYATNTTLR